MPSVLGMTWLPLPNVTESLRCLHDDDLVKQIYDARDAARQMADAGPASRLLLVKMWRGYEGALVAFYLQACKEGLRRGVLGPGHSAGEVWRIARDCQWGIAPIFPRWYCYALVHDSHASRLMRHRPEHYAHQFPLVPLDMPLVWPQNIPGRFDFSLVIQESSEASAHIVLDPEQRKRVTKHAGIDLWQRTCGSPRGRSNEGSRG